MNSAEELLILCRFCHEAGAKASDERSRRGLVRLGVKLAVLAEAAERREQSFSDRHATRVSLQLHEARPVRRH